MQIRHPMPSGVRVRVVFAMTTTLAVGACAQPALPGTGPSPVAVVDAGELRVRGGDTVYTIRGVSYEVNAPERFALGSVQRALDGASRQYRRYFGDDPTPVRLEVDTAAGVSAGAMSPASADVDSGGVRVVHLTVPSAVGVTPPQDAGRTRQGETPARDSARGAGREPRSASRIAGVGAVTRAVTNAWLVARGARAAASAGAPNAAAVRALPGWFASGAGTLLLLPEEPEPLLRVIARQRLMPLDSLLVHRQSGDEGGIFIPGGFARGAPDDAPAGARGGRGGARGGGMDGMGGSPRNRTWMPNLDARMVFPLQSAAFVRFLWEREGAVFVGALADTLAAGGRLEDALVRTRQLPHDVAGLASAWKLWLSSFAPDDRGRPRS